MSAVAGRLGEVPALAGSRPAEHGSQAAAALSFFALAAFASLVYGELLEHPPALRLLAAAALASCSAASLALRRRDGRPLLGLAARLVVLAGALVLTLLVVGIPAHLLAPAHWGTLRHRVGGGVDALGAWLWPYRDGDRWARLDVLAVAPLTVLLAGGLRFWPGAGRRRRAAALALLVGLFLTGAANTPQSEPGLRGLVMLALIACWLWAPTADLGGAARAARWLALPALLALALRPALSSTSAWIDFREAAGSGAATATFQWDQTYGPISWPRSAATMFTLGASHPGLLRVTSLDRFDGLRFLRSSAPPATSRLDLQGRLDRRFVTRSTVRIAGLGSRLLVTGDGLALRLHWLGGPEPAVSAQGDGTLLASSLAQGSVYSVVAYRPHPAPARLRLAPRAFPRTYLPYARFELPAPGASALEEPRFAAEADAPAPATLTVGPSAPGRSPGADPATAARLESSPYGPMFRLARGLAAGAGSSYDVALRTERYLLSNYTYDEHPAQTRYPLEAFLFEQRRGYCQQFSGAMALMLRMDGIPARVASGFKPDVYDRQAATWNIRALDAHSWVEVFFTGIGWVDFDPTPAAPVEVTGASSAAVSRAAVTGGGSTGSSGARTTLRIPTTPVSHGGGGPQGVTVAALVAALLAGAIGVLWLRGYLRLRAAMGVGEGEGAVEELRRVLAKGEASPGGLTLNRLERRMREQGEETAAEYLGALRDARYARSDAGLHARGRAALRRALMRERGPRGALALLAGMPPGAMRRGGGGKARGGRS